MTNDMQPTGLIPDGLLREIHKGDCVLFLGTDYPTGLPTGDVPPGRQAFADKLAAEVADLVEPGASPWEIAEVYEEIHGRQPLVAALKEWIEETGNKPYPIHHAVARLPVEAIITTAYDKRLEQALEKAGKSPVVVVNDVDVPFVGPDKVLVLKLFGDADQPKSLVLTDDDQRNLKSRLAPLLSVVRYLFVIKTLFFISYDLADDLFKDLYAEVSRGTGKYQRRGYAVWPGAADLDRRRWQKKGVELINARPASFLSQLQVQLAQLPSVPEEEPASLKLLDRPPYKFLDYFELEDAEIFFGREMESLLLWRKILSYRLVVLFGPSGAGKTSLLNAGVWPELARYGYRVCSVRVHTDPEQAVREAVEKALPAVRRAGAALSRLRPAREDLPSYFSRALKPADRLVVFLDQFEELFIEVAPEVRERFLRGLAACLRDEARDAGEVRFVFSLREDFLPRLEAHRDLLLQYYANSLCLEPLSRAAAELAITDPARRVGLAYEPELVQQLLDDLVEGGYVAPPQLQIVCDRLYDHAAQKAGAPTLVERKSIFRIGQPTQEVRATITAEQYRELGGVETILADYVDEVIAELPETQRDPAHDVLKAMITADETKAVLSQAEVVACSRVDLKLVGPVLENLVDLRLVRRMGGEQGTLYELAHEHLIAKIRSWVSPEELEAEIARRLLDQQVRRYREFGGLIDAETLERINRQRENPYLVIASPVELELLFRSALATGYEVAYWLERAREGGVRVEDITLEGLEDGDFRTRAAAVAALGQLGERSVEPIIGMLGDEYPQVRVAAIGALKQLRPGGVWREHLVYECYVPAGTFIMGDDEGYLSNEKPAHKVYLDAFYIGKYPVTNGEHKRYKDGVGQPFEIPKGKDNHPVVGISWYEARDYAAWAGMRLPTEAEWEKAASWDPSASPSVGEPALSLSKEPALSLSKGIEGGRKRVYPWGDKSDEDKFNIRHPATGSGIGDTTPVGKYSPEGDSFYGCADMAGNVSEWTSSLYRDYPYRANDRREDMSSPDSRVVRGGSFQFEEWRVRCSYRDKRWPISCSSSGGFRVVAAPFSPASEPLKR